MKLIVSLLFSLFFFSYCSIPSLEQSRIQLDSQVGSYFLIGKSIKYLLTSKEYSGSELLELDTSGFQKSENDFLNFGITEKKVWISFDLEKDSEEWVLELQSGTPSRIRYFVTVGNQILDQRETGMNFPESSRFIHHPFYIFPLPRSAGSYRIFLGIESNDSLTIPLILWKKDQFFHYDGWKYIFFSFFFGIMFSLSIYNFLLFISIKDRSYLYYVGYILFFLIFLFSTYGFSGYFFRDFFGFFPERILPLSAVLTAVFAIAFGKKFLQVEVYFPWLANLMIVFVIVGVLLSFIVFLIPNREAVLWANLYPFLGVFSLSIGTVLAIRKKYKPAYYFALAWFGLLITVSLYIFSNLGLISASFITQYSQAFGASFEALVLSLALGYRINDLREKEEESRRIALLREKEAREIQTRMAESFKRFVPMEFLKTLGKQSILDVELGNANLCKLVVLFMDVRGFTKLSELQSAEDTFHLLNSFLKKMEPIIQSRGGFIDKFIGDAIMALFPDPELSLLAALEMVSTSRQENQNSDGLQIGIGLHFGEMIMGTVGSPSRLDTTVIGDTVNLASRVEGLTKEYGVSLLATDSMIGLLSKDLFVFREIDRVRVKGRTRPITVYEVFSCQKTPS